MGAWTKWVITYATLFLNLILIFTHWSTYLVNVPIYTLGSLHLWRLFTAPFVQGGIINLLINFLFHIPTSNNFEKENGTIKAFLHFTAVNFVIQS